MENAIQDYCEAIKLLYKIKQTVAYFKSIHTKDSFEYEVLAYAEEKSKDLEREIKRLKKKWNITY